MIAEFCELLVVSGVLGALSVEDARRRVIPNKYLLARGVLGVSSVGVVAWRRGLHAAWQYGAEGLSAFLLMGLFLLAVAGAYERFCGRQSLGGGDIKLLAVLALYLGLLPGAACLALACLAAAIFSGATGRRSFPFGPFISGASLLFLWSNFLF